MSGVMNKPMQKFERTLLPLAKKLKYFEPENIILLNDTLTSKTSFVLKLCGDGTNIG
jgi:hypothetical protein